MPAFDVLTGQVEGALEDAACDDADTVNVDGDEVQRLNALHSGVLDGEDAVFQVVGFDSREHVLGRVNGAGEEEPAAMVGPIEDVSHCGG